MKNSWIVIADASAAKIYSQANNDNLHLEKEIAHPESRLKGSDLASDRAGHNQSAGDGHGAYVEKTGPKEFEAERFATEVADYLDNGRVNNAYADLVIASSPHFHGLLNKHMNSHVSELVSKHIEKDLTQIPEDQLLERLSQY